MRTDRPDRRGARRRAPSLPVGGSSGDVLYGRRVAAEVLRGRRKVRRLLLAEGVRDDEAIRDLVNSASARAVQVVQLPRGDLDARTDFANHQGVVLEAGPFLYTPFEDALSIAGTVLILDHVQNPQNFGVLLRTADATGTVAVIVARDRAVEVTPAVVSASAGAVEHLAVAQVPNIARAIEQLKRAGWWVAALDTGSDAVDLFTAPIPEPVALVVGAEGTGVGHNVRRHCDLVLSIPMVGHVASLNAATAGSVALFEILRRRLSAPPTQPAEVAGS